MTIFKDVLRIQVRWDYVWYELPVWDSIKGRVKATTSCQFNFDSHATDRRPSCVCQV